MVATHRICELGAVSCAVTRTPTGKCCHWRRRVRQCPANVIPGAAAVNTATSCHGGQDGVLWVDQRERENFFVI